MSLMEEPLIESPSKHEEPLNLRPPVGSEVHLGIITRTRNFLHTNPARRRMMGFSILSLLLLLLVLLAVLLWFTTRMGLWYSHPSMEHLRSSSACRLRMPKREFLLTQTVRSDGAGKFFNVTLVTNEPSNPIHQTSLHLCEESTTVIRSGPYCFVRPMPAVWQQLCEQTFPGNHEQPMFDHTILRPSAEAQLTEETWFANPILSLPNLFRNHEFVSLCMNTPSYHLSSKPPSRDYTLIPESETPMRDRSLTPHTPKPRPVLFDHSPDAEEVDPVAQMEDEFLDSLALNNDQQRRMARSVRPVVVALKTTTRDGQARCRKFSEVLDPSPIPLKTDEKPVTIARDQLVRCRVAAA